MNLSGSNLIGNEKSATGSKTFTAVNPVNGKELETSFHEATSEEVNRAAQKAGAAFKIYRNKTGLEKAEFLNAIAEEILSLGDDLIGRCVAETGLPEARITGERGRTINQLKLFAAVLREGSWLDARIDFAQPDREPLPKPDVRSMQIALGPVGVFGASNFPLAFSVAGGDSASALAAGCPIVVKAHPAHPGTCELVGNAIISAIQKTNMPDGTFSMVHGKSVEVGMAIVNNSFIKGIGFTGSYRGGKALFDAASRRPEPIPVYAEMGSTNPIFILPGALKEKREEIVRGLTASVTLGVGQFCTNPGLVFIEKSEYSDFFKNAAIKSFEKTISGVMLTSAIQEAYEQGTKRLSVLNRVELLAEGQVQGNGFQGKPALMLTTATKFISDHQLEKEVFGPSTLIVAADEKSELLKIAENLSGHLTTTVWASDNDLANYQELVDILKAKAGRLIINGFPTGVEVSHAMIHGGPFPATTDSRSTSVGTSAIRRFTRPVCFQNFPDEHLPDELKNDNPLKIWRLVDGEFTK
jgi:NADP-dependent aldehyde dehydrogenase